jgi:hypothetical protein
MIDDYTQVVGRAFVEPYTPDLRALVRVCGDHFEQHGDPRGTLIALGEARFDARGREGHLLQYEVDQHVLAHHVDELGDAAPLVRTARTLALEWRCGQLFGARLDTRRLGRDNLRKVVRDVVNAPAAGTLRRLAIRVRQDRDVDDAIGVLNERDWPCPLEHLLVLTSVRPQRLGGWGGNALTLAMRFPNLFCYAQGTAFYTQMPNELPYAVPRIIGELRAITKPLDVNTRTFLGRCLTYPDAVVRTAALDHVTDLGEHAAIYVELLAMLLQPNVIDTPLLVVEALRAMGRAAHPALDVLLRVPGRVKHYDTETRKAAGSLVASLWNP